MALSRRATLTLMSSALVTQTIGLPASALAQSPAAPTGATGAAAAATDNPFFHPWKNAIGLPDFALIKNEHYKPAFERGMAEHKAEIEKIVNNTEAPSFANTIEALETDGQILTRVSNVFGNLSGAETNDELQAIQRWVAPRLAAHGDEIETNPKLWARVKTLYEGRDGLGLTPEQLRLLERNYIRLKRSGADLTGAKLAKLKEINQKLAELTTKFAQNVLADEKAYTLVLETEEDRKGLPPALVQAALGAGEQRGLKGKHVISLARSSVEPFLTFSARRDLREKAFKAWAARGDQGGPTDNNKIISEIMKLRAEQAKLLGYPTYAHYKLDDSVAKTPEAAIKLLEQVWEGTQKKVAQERDLLQKLAQEEEGPSFKLQAWDWRYYAEKVRKRDYDVDDGALKPYFSVDAMREGAFYAAGRLFGPKFAQVTDAPPLYNPDVNLFRATREDGSEIGYFLMDNFSRPSKRSGAWMSSYRIQHKFAGAETPIVVNCNNVPKPPSGQQALLSYDDAQTLFHEFGHALHGLLSNVTYRGLAGTAVPRDFVEFPSQVFENWHTTPEVLNKYAIHFETKQPIPAELVEKVQKSKTFNEGFALTEQLAAAIVDMHIHMDPTGKIDPKKVEKDLLAKLNMPAEIIMRHRLPHFTHIFSGDGYSAGYYSYTWAEVMAADAWYAFKEAGDVFDPAVSKKLYEFVYSAGNSRDPAEAYRLFRGRDPQVEPFLKERGLIA